jgi:CDP-glucose 4,6-dehydratase
MAEPSAWRGRRVLVTGAGGFVGAWLSHSLVDAGAEVVALLRDEPVTSAFDLVGVAGRVSVIRGSVTDATLVERGLAEYEVDSCFHLAAQTIVGHAAAAPVATFETNIHGTWTVLEACRRQPRVSEIVVASTDKAYGSQPELPYRENMPLLGLAPYDASKACADILARSYHHTYGLNVAVTRCANIYGGGDINYSRLVPGTIRSVLAGERPVIRSDGSPIRDYLFVSDAVDAYLALSEGLRSGPMAGKAFNFGSNRPLSVGAMTDLILKVADRTDLEPDVQGSGVPPNEIDRQYLDSTRAREELGWKARVDLDAGLAQTVGWFRDHWDELNGD